MQSQPPATACTSQVKEMISQGIADSSKRCGECPRVLQVHLHCRSVLSYSARLLLFTGAPLYSCNPYAEVTAFCRLEAFHSTCSLPIDHFT